MEWPGLTQSVGMVACGIVWDDVLLPIGIGPVGYPRSNDSYMAQSVGMVACRTVWADIVVPVGIGPAGYLRPNKFWPGPLAW